MQALVAEKKTKRDFWGQGVFCLTFSMPNALKKGVKKKNSGQHGCFFSAELLLELSFRACRNGHNVESGKEFVRGPDTKGPFVSISERTVKREQSRLTSSLRLVPGYWQMLKG